MSSKFFLATVSFLLIVAAVYMLNVPAPSLKTTAAEKHFISASSTLSNRSADSAESISVEQDDSLKALEKTSLLGSDVDAANVFIVDGRIMIDHSLRFYYEYFLTLQGELSIDKIRALLAADARKRYEPLAAKYVIDLFQRYTDYLKKISILMAEKQQQEVLTVVEQQALAKQLQAKVFNEIEIKVLFDDGFLSVYDNENTQQGAYDNYREMQKLHPDASLEVLRVENFGVEVAARFAALDEKREQWKQRLNGYQCEKKAISQSEGLHAMDKKQSIESLQQRLFSAPEIRRVKALEKHKLMEAADC